MGIDMDFFYHLPCVSTRTSGLWCVGANFSAHSASERLIVGVASSHGQGAGTCKARCRSEAAWDPRVRGTCQTQTSTPVQAGSAFEPTWTEGERASTDRQDRQTD
jgi:hypothetical protein